MSIQFSEADIKNTLTPMAEAGQGNALRDELETLPLDQVIPVLKAIETQSKALHQSKPSLPEIDFMPSLETSRTGIEKLNLELDGSSDTIDAKPYLNYEPLYKESFTVDTEGPWADPDQVGQKTIVGRDNWADTKNRDNFFQQ